MIAFCLHHDRRNGKSDHDEMKKHGNRAYSLIDGKIIPIWVLLHFYVAFSNIKFQLVLEILTAKKNSIWSRKTIICA